MSEINRGATFQEFKLLSTLVNHKLYKRLHWHHGKETGERGEWVGREQIQQERINLH